MYIFYPISKGHFFVFKVFSENSGLMYGLYSRAASKGARMVYYWAEKQLRIHNLLRKAETWSIISSTTRFTWSLICTKNDPIIQLILKIHNLCQWKENILPFYWVFCPSELIKDIFFEIKTQYLKQTLIIFTTIWCVL